MVNKILFQWDNLLDSFSQTQKDIYFREEYVKLYETEKDKAQCFVCIDNDKVFIFPYLLRTFEYQDYLYHDFETAYGYGGPICNTEDNEFIISAWKEFFHIAREENYICGFVRFYPLFNNYKGFESIGRVIDDRHTIAIDLSGTEDEIWMSEIHTKNRNIIKKAAKEGLSFKADYDFSYLTQFRALYDATMQKLHADEFYYFDDAYYENIHKACPQSFIGVVEKDDEVISAAIFYYNAPYGHYHLAGSNQEYLRYSANNFLLWNAALELKRQGVTTFHLGGGTNSDEDNSLYCFKKKFSKSFYYFKLGKVIFDQSVYDSLCKDWEEKNPDKKEALKNILLKYKY